MSLRDQLEPWLETCEGYFKQHLAEHNTVGAAYYRGAIEMLQRVLSILPDHVNLPPQKSEE